MPHAILVDDTVDARELPHLCLTTADFGDIIAADGGEGFYRAKAGRPRPHHHRLQHADGFAHVWPT